MLRMSIDLMKENSFKLPKERSQKYPTQTITDVDYTDDIALLANTPPQGKSLLYSLKQAADSIVLHVNRDQTEYVLYSKRWHLHTKWWSFETSGQVHHCTLEAASHQPRMTSTCDKQRHEQLSIGYQFYGS